MKTHRASGFRLPPRNKNDDFQKCLGNRKRISVLISHEWFSNLPARPKSDGKLSANLLDAQSYSLFAVRYSPLFYQIISDK
jgi:hypothetical protein